MVALFSPLLFPNMGWSIDDYISHEQFGTDLYSNAAADTSPHAPPPQQHFLSVSLPSSPLPPAMERCDSLKFDGGSTDIGSGGGGGGEAAAGMVKKLSHNASERDRRKKMNGLFSSLRSLLPPSDQKVRMSIPTTVSRVVKYIPELQKEVEGLQKKKQELTSRVNSWQKFSASPPEFNKRRRVVGGHPHHHRQSYLSATQVGERDIVIQICSKKGAKNLFADALSCLEQEGLVLLDSSTFQTSEDRVNFYTLHLQVQGIEVMEVDKLKEKLLSYFNEEQQNFYHDTN